MFWLHGRVDQSLTGFLGVEAKKAPTPTLEAWAAVQLYRLFTILTVCLFVALHLQDDGIVG